MKGPFALGSHGKWGQGSPDTQGHATLQQRVQRLCTQWDSPRNRGSSEPHLHTQAAVWLVELAVSAPDTLAAGSWMHECLHTRLMRRQERQ